MSAILLLLLYPLLMLDSYIDMLAHYGYVVVHFWQCSVLLCRCGGYVVSRFVDVVAMWCLALQMWWRCGNSLCRCSGDVVTRFVQMWWRCGS